MRSPNGGCDTFLAIRNATGSEGGIGAKNAYLLGFFRILAAVTRNEGNVGKELCD
jgi:hypothetical protein